MESRGESGNVLGVNRAGAFAQAKTVAEDLRAAVADRIDEAAETVESQEATLQLRFGPDGFDRTGAVVDECAVWAVDGDFASSAALCSGRSRHEMIVDMLPLRADVAIDAEHLGRADRQREDHVQATDLVA